MILGRCVIWMPRRSYVDVNELRRRETDIAKLRRTEVRVDEFGTAEVCVLGLGFHGAGSITGCPRGSTFQICQRRSLQVETAVRRQFAAALCQAWRS